MRWEKLNEKSRKKKKTYIYNGLRDHHIISYESVLRFDEKNLQYTLSGFFPNFTIQIRITIVPTRP